MQDIILSETFDMRVNSNQSELLSVCISFSVSSEDKEDLIGIETSFKNVKYNFDNLESFYEYFLEICKIYSFRKHPYWGQITSERMFSCQLDCLWSGGGSLFIPRMFDMMDENIEFANFLIKNKVYLKKDFKLEDCMFEINEKNTVESICDKIELVIHNYKTDQLMKNVFSSKYKDIIDDITIQHMHAISNEKLPKISINLLKSKIAKCKTTSQLNNYLLLFFNNMLNWSREEKINELENIDGLQLNIHPEHPQLLLVKVNTYKAMNAIGSASWCIATSEATWEDYMHIDKGNSQWILYNFMVASTDNDSMVGITKQLDNEIYVAHYKDDTPVFLKDMSVNTDEIEIYTENDHTDEFLSINDTEQIVKYSYRDIFDLFDLNNTIDEQMEYCLNVSHVPCISQNIDLEKVILTAGVDTVSKIIGLYGVRSFYQILKRLKQLKTKNENLYNQLMNKNLKEKMCRHIGLKIFYKQEREIVLDFFDNDQNKLDDKIYEVFADMNSPNLKRVYLGEFPKTLNKSELNALILFITDIKNRSVLRVQLVGLLLKIDTKELPKIMECLDFKDIENMLMYNSKNMLKDILQIVDKESKVFKNIIKLCGPMKINNIHVKNGIN